MSYFDAPQNGESDIEDENSIGQNVADTGSNATDGQSEQSTFSSESSSHDISSCESYANGGANKEDKEQLQTNAMDVLSKPDATEESISKSTQDNNQENERGNSLLAEAERQAAIAAALSQTASASPSAVAGLAKQLATNSVSGSLGDFANANSGKLMRYYVVYVYIWKIIN